MDRKARKSPPWELTKSNYFDKITSKEIYIKIIDGLTKIN